MPGANAKTMLELFTSRAFPGLIGAPSGVSISDTEIFGYLNRALSRVQRKLRVTQVREAPITLTSGTQSYNLPALRLGSSIRQIMIKNRAGDGFIPLKARSNEFMRNHYNLDDVTGDVGDPLYWCPSNETVGTVATGLRYNTKFLIRPVPTWTWASGIIFDYPPINRPLKRIYNVATATSSAVCTLGSPTVTVTGGHGFLIGDEIGFVYAAQTDGVSTTPLGKETARRWYTIIDLSVVAGTPDVTTVTLAEPCDEFSLSGVPYIAAEVPPVVSGLPDEVAMSPVYFALEEYLLSKEPERAKEMGAYGSQLLSEYYQENPLGEVGYPRTNQFNWLWRNGGRGWPYGPWEGANAIWP